MSAVNNLVRKEAESWKPTHRFKGQISKKSCDHLELFSSMVMFKQL